MTHKFEWNKEKKELYELRTGDKLVDAKQNTVDGRYENKTIYPEATAQDMIKELEKQVYDLGVQQDAMKKTIHKMEKKLTPVDKVFLKKFQGCIARAGIDKQLDAMDENKEVQIEVSKQLSEIKQAMGMKE